MKGEKLKQELFSLLAEKGAKLMGAGDLSGIVSGEMKTGVSVAVPVPGKIVRDLQTAPTKEYYDAYYALNAKLDEIVSCGKRGIPYRPLMSAAASGRNRRTGGRSVPCRR